MGKRKHPSPLVVLLGCRSERKHLTLVGLIINDGVYTKASQMSFITSSHITTVVFKQGQ